MVVYVREGMPVAGVSRIFHVLSGSLAYEQSVSFACPGRDNNKGY